MALTHLLDTSVYSQPVRDIPLETVLARWSEVPDSSTCISALVQAGLLQGLMARDSMKFWRRYRELLAGQYTVLPFDEAVADTFARLVTDLQAIGRPKPWWT